MAWAWRIAGLLLVLLTLSGCYAIRSSEGGGQTSFQPPREVRSSNILLPEGYRIEAVATGLTFPTGVAFDGRGGVYVTESGYSYGEVWTTPRLLRIEPDGETQTIAEGSGNGPWTGAAFHDGAFFVAEGGQREGGRILKVAPEGAVDVLLEGLPSLGDHHTNGLVLGPDGWLYFGQGTATNSGVVGTDNFDYGWLERYPEFHDIPCRDITLAGENYATSNPLEAGSEEVATGAFLPFGRASAPGQVIHGQLPCSGAVLRASPTDGALDLVAWGFRNPFGLAFAPDGALFVTENMYDRRGSRPVYGAGDLLRRVEPGAWHGWPDYHGARAVASARYAQAGEPLPRPLLDPPPGKPPPPAANLGVHSSSNGFDFSRSSAFGHLGEAFVAQFGDMAPTVGKVLGPVGYRVVRVNVESGVVTDFITNRGVENGPASLIGGGGLERPIAARFSPDGRALYIVDFGVMTMTEEGPQPEQKTGVLWRVTPKGLS